MLHHQMYPKSSVETQTWYILFIETHILFIETHDILYTIYRNTCNDILLYKYDQMI